MPTTDTPPSHRALHWPAGLIPFTILAVVTAILLAGYETTLTPVLLIVDGQRQMVRTSQDTVGALLMDVGLPLHPEDSITPSNADTPLEPRMIVQVRRARLVTIAADGHTYTFRTHAASAAQALREAQVSVSAQDEVQIAGTFAPSERAPGKTRQTIAPPEPVYITIKRAIPFTLREEGRTTTHYTTAPTVGEALHRLGITLYLADGVEPGLNERLTPNAQVTIDRSVPVTVQVDGRTLRTRTHRQRVDEVLADLNIVLTGQDYAVPAVDHPLADDATIQVVRVTERFEIEQEPIPFEVAWQADPDLEIDHQRLLQEGARGIRERRIRVRYEDGIEVARQIENEYVAVPPTTKILGYGTKIIIRTMATSSGPVEYWRTFRMLATSYSASTAGTPKDAPWYGRTRLGLTMRFGIVAVDPRYISLGSNVYVPNYGVGLAGDTGGAIKGHRIDLGYDDDNLVLWYRWVDVYLLTPVPPADQINYVLQ